MDVLLFCFTFKSDVRLRCGNESCAGCFAVFSKQHCYTARTLIYNIRLYIKETGGHLSTSVP